MKKVLIANRGEIALRIIQACHDLGLQTVAVYSRADAKSSHLLHADEAVCIGDKQAQDSYLKIPHILSACEITGADAIHPGYGFLSENADFASICAQCSIEFIGPSHSVISLLGNKVEAKESAKQVGCPVIPGSPGVVESVSKAVSCAEKIGYPVLIKAVSGGGGRGIQIVSDSEELERKFPQAQSEAKSNFGNEQLYLEKFIEGPRHIEIQIMADRWGQVIHLGERDCTIQRNQQKLLEESPSPVLTPELREKMGAVSVQLAKHTGYVSAGTIEFLVDREQNFYFMEANTRIQVEHTVTEEVTGLDLVQLQLLIAMGESLPLTQGELSPRGHALQFRINAEDSFRGFAPRPGKLEHFFPPGGPHVRVDTACYSGYEVPPHYDSMIAKLIVRGRDREEAVRRGRRALREFYIKGIPTTIPFHQKLLSDRQFLSGQYDLHFVSQFLAKESTE